MSMCITHELPPIAWNAFVCGHPEGSIYHSREMFEVWDQANEFHPCLWACVSGDEILALFIPVEISLGGGLLRPFTTRSISFGSLLYKHNADGMYAVNKLLQTYIHETGGTSLFTELRNHSNLGEIQPILNDNSFTFESHLNYLIDLTFPAEVIWEGVSKSVRKHIHTAQKKNLIVEDVTCQDQFQIVYDLLRTTYNRIRVPLPSQTFFQSAFHVLMPKGMLKVHLIRQDGIPVSARLALVYKDKILDWYTGTDRSFQKLYPEEFMIWHTLQWGMGHGYRIFDFGGAGRPNENYGPREFKEKFGGSLVNYGRNTFVHSTFRLRISKLVYALYKRGMGIPLHAFSRTTNTSLRIKE